MAFSFPGGFGLPNSERRLERFLTKTSIGGWSTELTFSILESDANRILKVLLLLFCLGLG